MKENFFQLRSAAELMEKYESLSYYDYYFGDPEEQFLYVYDGDLSLTGDIELERDSIWGSAEPAAEDIKKYNIAHGCVVAAFADYINEETGEIIPSPVMKAGVQIGDTILTVNGVSIYDWKTTIKTGDTKATIIYVHENKVEKCEFELVYQQDGEPRLQLNTYLLEDENIAGLMILGDLTLDGSIINNDGDGGPMLIVEGAIKAKDITIGGSLLYAKSVTLTGDFYAFDNHGEFDVGDISANAIIIYDHAGEFNIVSGTYINDDDNDADYTLNDYQEMLEVQEEQKKSKGKKATAKKPVRKADIPNEAVRSKLKRIQALKDGTYDETDNKSYKYEDKEPSNLELFSYGMKQIIEVPSALLEVDVFKKIELFSNSITTIPASCQNWKNLKSLNISNNPIEELPKELVELKNLEHLEISLSNIEIAEQISQMTHLHSLKLVSFCWEYIEHFIETTDFKKFTQLEELELDAHLADQSVVKFPQNLCNIRTLKSLTLYAVPFESFPEEFSKLTQLEMLNLDCSMYYLKQFPDFSKFPNLKQLHANGSSALVGMKPSPTQLYKILSYPMPKLEYLFITRWEHLEGESKPLVLPDSFHHFPKLKEIFLDFVILNELPPSFMSLKKLEMLSVYDSEMISNIEQIKNAIPKLEVY